MASDSYAAVLRSAKHIEMSQVPVHECGPDDIMLKFGYQLPLRELQIKFAFQLDWVTMTYFTAKNVQISMKVMSICGTDTAMWVEGYFNCTDTPVKDLVLGHGGAGVVTRVGSNVTHLKEGDNVCMKPVVSCGSCNLCLSDAATICDERHTLGVPPHSYGCLMQRIIHPAKCVYKVPDSMSMDKAAMIEQLCIAYRACVMAGISKETTVLITGAGSLGLCCLLICKAMGARAIGVTDLETRRLEVARLLGASHTFTITRDEKGAAISDKIVNAMGGNPDCVLETSGAESAIDLAVLTVKTTGTIVQVGLPHEQMFLKVNIMQIVMKEIQMKGSLGYMHGSFEKVIEMVGNGSIDVMPMISHHFPLGKTQEAFETANRREGLVIMIDVDQYPES